MPYDQSTRLGRRSAASLPRMIAAERTRRLLLRHQLGDVFVRLGERDEYDTALRCISLTYDHYFSETPEAHSVGAHEVGHALQHRERYRPLYWRLRLLPAAKLLCLLLPLAFLLALLSHRGLVLAGWTAGGLLCFHCSLFIVEGNASIRALQLLSDEMNVEELNRAGRYLLRASFSYLLCYLASPVALVRRVF